MATSPTQRTLKYYRDKGYDCAIVERFVGYGKFGVRKDMFGFGDIMAMGNGEIICIQSCGQAFSEHHKKITQDPVVSVNVQKWLSNGGRLVLIGWRKLVKKRGMKAKKWVPRVQEYTLAGCDVEIIEL